MAEGGTVWEQAIRLAEGLFVGIPAALVTYWVKDRRKTRAEAEVAERTTDAEVDLREIGSWEAGVAYLGKAFAEERASKDRRITELEAALAASRDDCDRKTNVLREQLHESDLASDRIQRALEREVRERDAAVRERDRTIATLEATVGALSAKMAQLEARIRDLTETA